MACSLCGRPARDAAAPRCSIRSIAVLPFQNLSGDPSQEYFSDGMTDILITNLAQIHALNVTSRTSAMQFKSTKQTIPEIGRVLGVDAIVESSVQRSGNRVRIAAQLIRASTDTHLWAKEFNGSASDLLELQSDVARSIAEEIRVQIAPEERERLSKVQKVSPEAHDAFLLGRYQYGRGDLEGYKQAIQSYERAIELQSDYGAAYAALSMVLWNLRNAGGPDHTDRIRSAAYRAVQLDPALAEAHAVVGIISMDDWEWERAEQAFRKGMDLNPDSQDTCLCYAGLLSILGRHAESVALTQHSAAVNPLSSVTFANLGMRLLEARRYQEAETAFHRALGLEPANFVARFFLAEVFSSTSRFEDAISTLDTPAFQGTAWLAKTYASAGRRREATELIRTNRTGGKAGGFRSCGRRIRAPRRQGSRFRMVDKGIRRPDHPCRLGESRYAYSTPSVTIHGSTPWSHGCTCQANDLGQELTPQSVGHPSVIDLPLARWVDFRSRTMSAMTG